MGPLIASEDSTPSTSEVHTVSATVHTVSATSEVHTVSDVEVGQEATEDLIEVLPEHVNVSIPEMADIPL
jgi:hypothetical protein